MNNPEDIVQIAIAVAKEVYLSHDTSALLEEFELKLRRQLMQASYVSDYQRLEKKEHTYTIPRGSTMGTWTTTQTSAMGTQSNIINKEILNG